MRIILTRPKFRLGESMQKNKGFTLIELIVTIAVLAIVASIAAPSFVSTLASQNLNGASNEIASALGEGRSRAMVIGNTVVVCPNKDVAGANVTEAICVNKLLSSADANQFIDQKRVILVNLPKKVEIKSNNYGVVFKANGTTSSVTSIITCSKNISRTINVALIGSLTQTKGTC